MPQMTLDAEGNLYAIYAGEKGDAAAVFNQPLSRVRKITVGAKGADSIAVGP